jgi:transaldolase
VKLFLDSADANTWVLPPGCPSVQGVTTNPSLVHQARLPVSLPTYLQLIERAAALGLTEIMLQLPRPGASEARQWAQTLLEAAQKAGVALTLKLPCHPDWQAALQVAHELGASTLLTGVANPVQLLWAGEQGARYVAPYVGRLQAEGRAVWPFIRACIAQQNQGGPRLLAASIKSAEVLSELLALGAYAVTARPEFIASLALDPLTQNAMAQFEADIQASTAARD